MLGILAISSKWVSSCISYFFCFYLQENVPNVRGNQKNLLKQMSFNVNRIIFLQELGKDFHDTVCETYAYAGILFPSPSIRCWLIIIYSKSICFLCPLPGLLVWVNKCNIQIIYTLFRTKWRDLFYWGFNSHLILTRKFFSFVKIGLKFWKLGGIPPLIQTVGFFIVQMNTCFSSLQIVVPGVLQIVPSDLVV